MPAIAKRFVSELDQLRHLEGVVEQNLKGFLEAGNALWEIDEKKLWKHADAPEGEADYANFDDYRERKWGLKITDRHARQLISNAKTASKVGRKHASALTSHRQLTELGKVPDDKIDDVLDIAVEKANGKPVTAKLIREAKEELLPPDDADDAIDAADEAEEAAIVSTAVSLADARRQQTESEAAWDAIGEEAEEIAQDIGNHARMADFLDTIAEQVSENPAIAAVRLGNMAIKMRAE